MQARQFLGTYLQTKDIPAPVKAIITSTKEEQINDEDRPKLVLYFAEFEKGLVCNVTNINMLIDTFNTSETDEWVGKSVVLNVDPNVMFSGKRVGGIRIQPAHLTRQSDRGPIVNDADHAHNKRRSDELSLEADTTTQLDKVVDKAIEQLPGSRVVSSRGVPMDNDDDKSDEKILSSESANYVELRKRYIRYVQICTEEDIDVSGRGYHGAVDAGKLNKIELDKRINLMKRWLSPAETKGASHAKL